MDLEQFDGSRKWFDQLYPIDIITKFQEVAEAGDNWNDIVIPAVDGYSAWSFCQIAMGVIDDYEECDCDDYGDIFYMPRLLVAWLHSLEPIELHWWWDTLISRIKVFITRLASGDGIRANCTADEFLLFSFENVCLEAGCEPMEELLFSHVREMATEDSDIEFLFNPAADGIEDTNSEENKALGVVNLHPRDWFSLFQTCEVR